MSWTNCKIEDVKRIYKIDYKYKLTEESWIISYKKLKKERQPTMLGTWSYGISRDNGKKTNRDDKFKEERGKQGKKKGRNKVEEGEVIWLEEPNDE